jgi:TetR/AcrR family transcriptional regulator, tetracycline repressor protein
MVGMTDTPRAEPGVPADPPEPPWRSAPKRRSVPRPQLSRDVIVAAALRVVETAGGQALTMRRVAAEIGVSASSIYGYVASKDELVQLVLDQIIAEVKVPSPAGGWQEAVKDVGRSMLAVFRSHPGVAGLTLGRVPWGPSMLGLTEFVLGQLRSAGLPDQVAAYFGDLAGLYVGGIAYEEEIHPAGDPAAEQAEVAQVVGWLQALPADRFPNTVALAPILMTGGHDERFEWGMDIIIRGMASFLDRPPDPAGHWPPA